jgi:hypothetical protein
VGSTSFLWGGLFSLPSTDFFAGLPTAFDGDSGTEFCLLLPQPIGLDFAVPWQLPVGVTTYIMFFLCDRA